MTNQISNTKTRLTQFTKIPVDNIKFRSSSFGIIAQGIENSGLSENQKNIIIELELKQKEFIGLSEKQHIELQNFKSIEKEFIGLSEKQAEELEKFKDLISEKSTLTTSQQVRYDEYNRRLTTKKILSENQQKKRTDYESRLRTLKTLSENEKSTLQNLYEKRDAPPTLTQGAKTHIRKIWLYHEKGFKIDVSTKGMRKGQNAEEDGITLISLIDGVMYSNNNKKPNGGRKTIDNLTGACDVITEFKEIEMKVIDDIKLSWNAETFMNTTFTSVEEWQGHCYMHLYNVPAYRLRRCLVDCSPQEYEDELYKFCMNNRIIDHTLPEYAEIMLQFKRNLMVEFSGLYSREERVKTFLFARDEDKIATIRLAQKLAIEYYKTISLNGEN